MYNKNKGPRCVPDPQEFKVSGRDRQVHKYTKTLMKTAQKKVVMRRLRTVSASGKQGGLLRRGSSPGSWKDDQTF